MPKKQPKNDFYFFMTHYKKREEDSGRRFRDMKQVADECGPEWSRLTTQEKTPFKRQAEAHKAQVKKYGERYTSHGVPLSQLHREQEESRAKERRILQEIDRIVEQCELRDELTKKEYYIVSFNFFCISHNNYTPAEMGLVRFSLLHGIKEEPKGRRHRFINPGPRLPLGSAADAKDLSEKTHQLPLPPHAMGEGMMETLQSFYQFIESNEPNERGPTPVFYFEEERETVENCLRALHSAAEMEMDDTIVLYPISYLLYRYMHTVERRNRQEPKISQIVAKAFFDRDTFVYHPDTACDYHKDKDATKHCALSCAVRHAYTFIDVAAKDYNITLVAGTHVPRECDTAIFTETDPFDEKVSYVTADTSKASAPMTDYDKYAERRSTVSDFTNTRGMDDDDERTDQKSYASEYPSLSGHEESEERDVKPSWRHVRDPRPSANSSRTLSETIKSEPNETNPFLDDSDQYPSLSESASRRPRAPRSLAAFEPKSENGSARGRGKVLNRSPPN